MSEWGEQSASWRQRGAEYNHDWLQSRLSPLLRSGLNFMRGDFTEDGFAARFAWDVVCQWRAHRGQASELANSFANEMSPRRYLARAPLRQLSQECREWLGLVVQECWLARQGKRALLTEVVEAGETAEALFSAMEASLVEISQSGDQAALLALRKPLEQLAARCGGLSAAISRLAARVEVV